MPRSRAGVGSGSARVVRVAVVLTAAWLVATPVHAQNSRDTERKLQTIKKELKSVAGERREIENSRWTPRRTHRLAAAQRREGAAAEELAQTRRSLEEHLHGKRPFVSERQLEQRHTEQLERMTERIERSRARSRGREL